MRRIVHTALESEVVAETGCRNAGGGAQCDCSPVYILATLTWPDGLRSLQGIVLNESRPKCMLPCARTRQHSC